MPFQVSKSIRPVGQLAGALGLCLTLGCGLASALDQATSATPAWSGPQGFDLATETTEKAPSAAMDASGNVFVAWDQLNTSNQILVDFYPAAAAAWNAMVALPGQSGSAQDPAVAVGNGIFGVAWDQGVVSGTPGIVCQFYDPSGSPAFSSVQELSAGPATAPVIAMDVSGDAAIAWTQALSTGFTGVQVQRYQPGATPPWTGPVATLGTSTTNAFSPQVATDDLGDVVVAWLEAADPATGPYTLQTAWFIGGNVQSWFGPYSPQVSGSDAIAPAFALGMNTPSQASGVAQLAWSESTDGSTYQIYSATFNAYTAAWAAPLLVSATGINAFQPTLALDDAGDAQLAWVQGAASATSGPAPDLWAAILPAGALTWAAPMGVSTATQGVQAPKLAMSSNGNGAVVWLQYFAPDWRVLASLDEVNYAWSSPALLNVVTGGDASAPTVAVNATPQAVAAWCQLDASGISHVYTNVYQ